MVGIQVTRNGSLVCRAGIENATILSVHVHAWIGGDAAAQLDVTGMCELSEGKSAHVYWDNCVSLDSLDDVVVAFTQFDSPSLPLMLKPIDSPEYLEEQRQFEEFGRAFRGPMEKVEVRFPTVAFDLTREGETIAHAALREGEEHVLCTVTWDRWRPDACRIYVRSFGGLTGPDDERGWYRGELAEGEHIGVRVVA